VGAFEATEVDSIVFNQQQPPPSPPKPLPKPTMVKFTPVKPTNYAPECIAEWQGSTANIRKALPFPKGEDMSTSDWTNPCVPVGYQSYEAIDNAVTKKQALLGGLMFATGALPPYNALFPQGNGNANDVGRTAGAVIGGPTGALVGGHIANNHQSVWGMSKMGNEMSKMFSLGGAHLEGNTYKDVSDCFKRRKDAGSRTWYTTQQFEYDHKEATRVLNVLSRLCSKIPVVDVAPFGVGTSIPLPGICSSIVGVGMRANAYTLRAQKWGVGAMKESRAYNDEGCELAAATKTLCDLHCLRDMVAKDDAAILQNFGALQSNLITNIQKMLHYSVGSVYDYVVYLGNYMQYMDNQGEAEAEKGQKEAQTIQAQTATNLVETLDELKPKERVVAGAGVAAALTHENGAKGAMDRFSQGLVSLLDRMEEVVRTDGVTRPAMTREEADRLSNQVVQKLTVELDAASSSLHNAARHLEGADPDSVRRGYYATHEAARVTPVGVNHSSAEAAVLQANSDVAERVGASLSIIEEAFAHVHWARRSAKAAEHESVQSEEETVLGRIRSNIEQELSVADESRKRMAQLIALQRADGQRVGVAQRKMLSVVLERTSELRARQEESGQSLILAKANEVLAAVAGLDARLAVEAAERDILEFDRLFAGIRARADEALERVGQAHDNYHNAVTEVKNYLGCSEGADLSTLQLQLATMRRDQRLAQVPLQEGWRDISLRLRDLLILGLEGRIVPKTTTMVLRSAPLDLLGEHVQATVNEPVSDDEEPTKLCGRLLLHAVGSDALEASLKSQFEGLPFDLSMQMGKALVAAAQVKTQLAQNGLPDPHAQWEDLADLWSSTAKAHADWLRHLDADPNGKWALALLGRAVVELCPAPVRCEEQDPSGSAASLGVEADPLVVLAQLADGLVVARDPVGMLLRSHPRRGDHHNNYSSLDRTALTRLGQGSFVCAPQEPERILEKSTSALQLKAHSDTLANDGAHVARVQSALCDTLGDTRAPSIDCADAIAAQARRLRELVPGKSLLAWWETKIGIASNLV
jgi:hypothetical protein